ncbi:MAG: 2-amino-4-hydroxy-6-hydroxymethyldihydropteridine diphosphokinase [Acidobacteriota bacterium]
MMQPIRTYISAGSNIGDKDKNLEHALKKLEAAGAVAQTSPIFETEPVGYEDQPWFLNMVVGMDTRMSARDLLRCCMQIETSQGRTRSFKNAPRTLDLDILFYGDLVLEERDLCIPHPRLTERRFVLVPLARIAPDLVHPIIRKSIRTLLHECKDTSWIRPHR